MNIAAVCELEPSAKTTSSKNLASAREQAAIVGAYAYMALIKEVELTPKPGLVDRHNRGAHQDMDITTFRASAAAIAPWFPAFFLCGWRDQELAATDFLPRLRQEGLACERDMFRATQGVNTHKGSIFALGLLCAAAGRLSARNQRLDSTSLCNEVARLCASLVSDELANTQSTRTAGELLFQRYGMGGARGEAASGFATARQYGLTAYRRIRTAGGNEEAALHEALIGLMAYNQDTNLVSRGGIEGLCYVQEYAQSLLKQTKPGLARKNALHDFDQALIHRNLSPGGSADLLSVTWFLSCFPD